MSIQEELTGTVEKCIYRNDENGFAVFVLTYDKDHSTLVRGYVPSIQPGEQVTLQGAWTMHPKFGKQFEAQSCVATTPTSIVGLKKYLGSGLIKGIGPKYAEKLVDAFGLDTLTVIEHQPERLRSVGGIGEKRLELICKAWVDQKAISHIMLFLQEKGISPTYAVKIFKAYGQEAIAKVTENPYRLAEDIWGIGFKTADQIAQKLEIAHDSPKRIRAGILFALSQQSGQGHLYVELNQLKTTTLELLELTADEHASLLKQALHDLHQSDKIKLISKDGAHYIATTQNYYTEYGIAQRIKRLMSYPSSLSFSLNEIYQQLRVASPGQVELNEDQQRGIMSCLQNKISIVTGGPGTGKTTLIKRLITILDEQNIRYKLAAPTGRAAKRMSESTGKPAVTIHRLLEFDPQTFGFTRNEHNALAVDYLILDESSMLDVFLANSVIKAVPEQAHVLFIGDTDQLPSVGPGNVLHDLLASGKVTHVRLTQIFRQAQDSMIIVNAHRVNQGEFPIAPLPEAKRDFIFIKEEDPVNLPTHLESIYKKGLFRYGIAPDDAITLVPMNRGVAGTQKLNADLQLLQNGTQSERQLSYGGCIYKEQDRVMQVRNNYDKLVFNGDIGIITEIDMEERALQVRFIDRIVPYEFSEIDELVLAYAISIHKSQGSEFDAVIIPIFMQHFMLLKRNLIYTAITRAKKLCICIGQPKAIAMAIKNGNDTKRVTFLIDYLTSDLVAR
jgi:exodeoxyribonuclease V alpha subunit